MVVEIKGNIEDNEELGKVEIMKNVKKDLDEFGLAMRQGILWMGT